MLASRADAYVGTPNFTIPQLQACAGSVGCPSAWDPEGTFLEPSDTVAGDYTITQSGATDVRDFNQGMRMFVESRNAAGEVGTRTAAEGAAEAATEATAVEAAGAEALLPTIGAALPWVAAGVAAVEVCQHLVSNGCWLFNRDDVDPGPPPAVTIGTLTEDQSKIAITSSGEWTDGCGGTQADPADTCPAGTLYKNQLKALRGHALAYSNNMYPFGQAGGSCSAPDMPPPPWQQIFFTGPVPCGANGVGIQEVLFGRVFFDLTTHTHIRPEDGDDPSIPNYDGPQPGINVSSRDKLMQALMDHLTPQQFGHVVQSYANYHYPAADPLRPPDPYVPKSIPDCQGMAYSQCLDALQAAGFGVTHRTYAETDAEQIPLPQSAPSKVVRTRPPATATATADTDIEVETNPDDIHDMFYEVPDLGGAQAEGGSSSDDDWDRRVGPFGLRGADRLEHAHHAQSPFPGVEPGAVIHTSPAPGAHLQYGQWPELELQPQTDTGTGTGTGDDPSDETEPETGSDGWSPPAIRSIDLSPLTSVPSGCKFPFCIFSFLSSSFGGWSGGAANCPQPDLDLNTGGDDEGKAGTLHKLTLHPSLCKFEPAMAIVRPMVLIVSFLGLAWLFATTAMGLGGDAARDD